MNTSFIPLMFAALAISALSGCDEAKTTQATIPANEQKAVDEGMAKQARISPDNPPAAKTIYPRALWGTWRLGSEPCRLPVNPDEDGRLHITSARIVGYETYSEPISITVESFNTSTWRIKSKINYLGSHITEEIQIFELNKNNLTVKGDGYEEKYVKCISPVNEALVENKLAEDMPRAQLPEELHGLWIGSAQICPAGSEYFDGEFMLEISTDKMFGYEEEYKPTKISATSSPPRSWHIEMMVDVGPSGFFYESDPMVLTLEKERLKVEKSGSYKIYKKCRLKTTRGANNE